MFVLLITFGIFTSNPTTVKLGLFEHKYECMASAINLEYAVSHNMYKYNGSNTQYTCVESTSKFTQLTSP